MEDGTVFVHRSGKEKPLRPLAVWADMVGCVGAGEGMMPSGLCPRGTGVRGGVGGGCTGCVHGR